MKRLTPVALIAVAVSLALAGCTGDSLATDYNSNDANGNYISPRRQRRRPSLPPTAAPP